jgi:sigma-B regulation protein RsbU (phosphoserine phosphatase)
MHTILPKHSRSIARQVMDVSMVAALLMTFLILLVATILYFRDRKAFLNEVQHHKLKRAEIELARDLAKIRLSRTWAPVSDAPTEVSSRYGIPRLPEAGEIFVGAADGQALVFTRASDGRFLSGRLEGLALCRESYVTCYAITSFGQFVASNARSYTPEMIRSSAAVQTFLAQGLSEGVVTSKDKNSHTSYLLTSYTEVGNSNIILFMESSVLGLILSVARLALLGMLLVFAGVVFLWVFLKSHLVSLLRPFQLIIRDFGSLAEGDYRVARPVGLALEFDIIYKYLQATALALHGREAAAQELQADLEKVLALIEGLSSYEDFEKIITRATMILAEALQVPGQWTLSLYLISRGKSGKAPHESSNTYSGVYRLWGRAKAVEGSRLDQLSQAQAEVFEASRNSRRVKPGEAENSGYLLCECRYQEEIVAYLEWQTEKGEALSPKKKHFLNVFVNSLASSRAAFQSKSLVAHKARIDAQLQASQSIQRRFASGASRQIGRIEWEGYLRSAERVGGDFYTARSLHDGKYALFVIADATGHGLDAAMLTAVSHGVLSAAESSMPLSPGNQTMAVNDGSGLEMDWIRSLAESWNLALWQAGESEILMSALVLLVETETGRFWWLCAGHPRPLIVGKQGLRKFSTPLNDHFGSKPSQQWRIEQLCLERGDFLLGFTDGLVENHLPGGEPIRLRSLAKTLSENYAQKPTQSAREIVSFVKNFVPHLADETAPSHDDTTFFVIRYD